jgi:signal recognition particle GTPase
MARGWESKSVEEQMAGQEAAGKRADKREASNADERKTAEQDRVRHAQLKQSLELQRENILAQRTSNAGRRAALEAALEEIEKQLAELSGR